MAGILTASEREAALHELQQVFDSRTAETVLGVMDSVVSQARVLIPTREDFSELKKIVAELAEAQKRTEQRVEELAEAQKELAEAQKRTEQRLEELAEAQKELAEAQKRTEQRVEELAEAQKELAEAQKRTEQRVEELAEAQKRTEQRVEELAEAQKRSEERLNNVEAALERLAQAQLQTERAVARLAEQVGGLSETVGGDIEDIAYIVIHDVLQREFDWEVGALERVWKIWNGKEEEEVNVFGQATDPARPGHAIWIVGEAKHNLTLKEVRKFAELIERARRNLTGEVFPVCFCYRARPEVVKEVQNLGLRLVYSYGKLV